MVTQLVLALSLLGSDGILEIASRANALATTLRMAKPSYVFGEPIAIEMTLANKSGGVIYINDLDIPCYGIDWFAGGLSLDLSKSRIKPVELERISGRFGMQTIKNGSEFKHVFYLQQFASQPDPGDYRIPARLHVYEHRYPKVAVGFFAHGNLSFKVTAADKHKLNEAMSGYLDSYRRVRTVDERRQAARALTLIETADVLPYLARAFASRREIMHPSNIDGVPGAIERFSTNKDALWMVQESLEKKTNMTPIDALTLLSLWKHRIPNETINKLRKREDEELQAKLTEYLKIIQKELKETNYR